jgi:hypothetical protein
MDATIKESSLNVSKPREIKFEDEIFYREISKELAKESYDFVGFFGKKKK